MNHQRLPSRSLCICIADKLRERILAHEWKPGEAINDGSIALAYGVSRTPVREALKLLCHEGLLELNGRRGMAVAVPTMAQLREAWALQQWLSRFVQEQGSQLPCGADSLAHHMLQMAGNRLQLARAAEVQAACTEGSAVSTLWPPALQPASYLASYSTSSPASAAQMASALSPTASAAEAGVSAADAIPCTPCIPSLIA